MKIIAFAGSNSRNSINRKLASYAAHQFKNADVEMLDLNDYEMPIFGVDREAEIGQQSKALMFLNKISEADLLVVSLAEHNGSYTVAFKNILDWASRINGNVFQDKPMLLMSTSTGKRGAISVLEAAQKRFPIHGAKILGTFSLPSF
ncbi:MAG: NAD(P)H-dependent oxidoreductase, partial [Ignavibacteria bacterium]|nr:NAD(P)H-dependent oxidoreductase [Ignavibacteria bacterium]